MLFEQMFTKHGTSFGVIYLRSNGWIGWSTKSKWKQHINRFHVRPNSQTVSGSYNEPRHLSTVYRSSEVPGISLSLAEADGWLRMDMTSSLLINVSQECQSKHFTLTCTQWKGMTREEPDRQVKMRTERAFCEWTSKHEQKVFTTSNK